MRLQLQTPTTVQHIQFPVSFFLRRISDDPSVMLSEQERLSLAKDILRIEEDTFADNGHSLSHQELSSLAKDWLQRTRVQTSAP